MKKFLCLLFATIFFFSKNIAQDFTIIVKNNTNLDFKSNTLFDHGVGMIPNFLGRNTTETFKYLPTAGAFCTGVEGHLIFSPEGNQNESASVYYNNPYIGSSSYSLWSSSLFSLKVTSWDVNQHLLTVELSGGEGIQNPVKPPVLIALNVQGVIKGTIYWNKNEIQSPDTYPFGKAFSFKVLAPTQFVQSDGPFTFEKLGQYNGNSGYFQGNKMVGNVTYETAPSLDPNYVEIRYTITGVPTEVPIQLDITTDYSVSKWVAGPQKPKPGEDYVFAVGTFPNTSKSIMTIDNNLLQMAGIDFNCEGDWMKLDANGNIINGGDMVNRIASRKSNSVLPGSGMLIMNNNSSMSTQMMAAPGVQNKSQGVQVQKVKTSGMMKVKQ